MTDLGHAEADCGAVVGGCVLRGLRPRAVAVAVVKPELLGEGALLEVDDLEPLRVEDRPPGALDPVQEIGLLGRVEARAGPELLVEDADLVQRRAPDGDVRARAQPKRVGGPAVLRRCDAGQLAAGLRAHRAADGACLRVLVEELDHLVEPGGIDLHVVIAEGDESRVAGLDRDVARTREPGIRAQVAHAGEGLEQCLRGAVHALVDDHDVPAALGRQPREGHEKAPHERRAIARGDGKSGLRHALSIGSYRRQTKTGADNPAVAGRLAKRAAGASRWALGRGDELGGRVVAVSVHLDDAIFSVGAALARAARRGADVTVLTVLANDPDGDAAGGDWDARAGFASAADAARGRREEDRRACAAVGARPVWLPFGDKTYGLGAEPEAVAGAVVDAVGDADVVLLPGFPLLHEDHALVAGLLAGQVAAPLVGQFVEQPYAMLYTAEPQ